MMAVFGEYLNVLVSLTIFFIIFHDEVPTFPIVETENAHILPIPFLSVLQTDYTIWSEYLPSYEKGDSVSSLHLAYLINHSMIFVMSGSWIREW